MAKDKYTAISQVKSYVSHGGAYSDWYIGIAPKSVSSTITTCEKGDFWTV